LEAEFVVFEIEIRLSVLALECQHANVFEMFLAGIDQIRSHRVRLLLRVHYGETAEQETYDQNCSIEF
jgi:hypothetical protein